MSQTGWLPAEFSLSGEMMPAFPILAFVIHGAWMLWVIAPQAAIKKSTVSP